MAKMRTGRVDASVREKLREANAEISKLRAQIEEGGKQVQKLGDLSEEWEADMTSLKIELANERRKVEERDAAITELRNQLDELRMELEHRKDELQEAVEEARGQR